MEQNQDEHADVLAAFIGEFYGFYGLPFSGDFGSTECHVVGLVLADVAYQATTQLQGFEHLFQQMLQMDLDEAVILFQEVAQELFTEINCGRIIIFLSFSGLLLVKCVTQRKILLERCLHTSILTLLRGVLGNWLEQNGGYDALLNNLVQNHPLVDLTTSPSYRFLTYFFIFLCGAAVAALFSILLMKIR
ncbi:F9 [Felid gammaherpesvirus 1]|uniref:F9 n=1 Tax=Felid gammaherpesvirus 1 TaxID=2560468 RepID=A0A0M4MPT9_9GAMA|nr:F9 [Felis catus gammaherpesvirus 1]ALE14715.1 F9 [Felis catus gammaherpesvirus 1]